MVGRWRWLFAGLVVLFVCNIVSGQSPSIPLDASPLNIEWSPVDDSLAILFPERVLLIDTETGSTRWEQVLDLPEDIEEPCYLQWSDDGKSLAIIMRYANTDVGVDTPPHFLTVLDAGTGHTLREIEAVYPDFTLHSTGLIAHAPRRYLGILTYNTSVVVISPHAKQDTISETALTEAYYHIPQFSPDASQLAARVAGHVWVWNWQHPDDFIVLSAQIEDLQDLAWDRSGKRIITLGDTLRVWDSQTGEPIASFVVPDQLLSFLRAHRLRLLEDNSVLVVSDHPDETTVHMNLDSGQIIDTRSVLTIPEAETTVYWNHDGNRVALEYEDAIHIVEPTVTAYSQLPEPTLTRTAEPLVLSQALQGAAFWTPEGEIATKWGSNLHYLTQDPPTSHIFEVHNWVTEEPNGQAVYHAESGLMALALEDRQNMLYRVELWDTINNISIAHLTSHHGPITEMVFSTDGSLLATGSEDLSIRVWDTQTGEERATLWGMESSPIDISFSHDNTLVVAVGDNRVRFWDSQTGEVRGSTTSIHEYMVGGYILDEVWFSPDGTQLAYRTVLPIHGDPLFGYYAQFNLADVATLEDHPLPKPDSFRPHSLFWSPDGTYIALTPYKGLPLLMNTVTGSSQDMNTACISVENAEEDTFRFYSRLAFHPTKPQMAVAPNIQCDFADAGTEDNTPPGYNVLLFDLENLDEYRILEGVETEIIRIAYSSDGTEILAQDVTRSIHVWNALTGGRTRYFQSTSD